MTFRLQVLSSIRELEDYEPSWASLPSTALHPMHSVAWYVNACSYVHAPTEQLHIMLLWHGEQLAAIAPLILARASGARRYEIIGTRTLYEPSGILTRNAEAAGAIAEAIAELKYPVLMMRLSARDGFRDCFSQSARGSGVVFSRPASGSPYIDLIGGWEKYYESLPSRLKNVVRRGRRQLDKMGRVELTFTVPEPEVVNELLKEAFEVELRSWKRRTGSAVLLRPDLREFFLHYGAELARRGELLISFLRLDGRAIATQVANVSCGAYWQLKIGYDETYAKQLVGLQLQLETIKWSLEQGLSRYEFLGTAEPWIREWTQCVHECTTLLYYPFTASGLGALVQDQFSRLWAKMPRMRSGAA